MNDRNSQADDAATVDPAPLRNPLPAADRTPLIAGNWKMNLDHLQAIALVQKLSWSLKDARHDYGAAEVAVFPPFTDLRSVQTLLAADKLSLVLGAQDVSPHESGAYTGDISAAMLAKLDVSYVLVGHSERRHGHGEDDETIGRKALTAHRAGMVPMICVGETAEDLEQHGAAAIPLAQLTAVLAELPADAEFVVAYEPVWAIGSGQAATPEQAEEVARALREALRDLRDDERAASTRILYGGSVASQNVASFLRQPNVDGALVGGASLKPDEFSRIAQFQKHVTAG
ncbi:MAG: triose-phosphate isomerase [Leucobacter sp.]